MKRSDALVILAQPIVHICPYKEQDAYLEKCYRDAQNIEHQYCYGCDHVANTLKPRFGLKTFRRRVRVSRCARCDDPAVLHENEAPFKGKRMACPGFVKQADEGWLTIPKNAECTKWFALNLATGERVSLKKYLGEKRDLAGAPGTVPSDERDAERSEAAKLASQKRAFDKMKSEMKGAKPRKEKKA